MRIIEPHPPAGLLRLARHRRQPVLSPLCVTFPRLGQYARRLCPPGSFQVQPEYSKGRCLSESDVPPSRHHRCNVPLQPQQASDHARLQAAVLTSRMGELDG